MKKPGFQSTARKGFHMTFDNGWTVSVQWGPGNYCNNRCVTSDYPDPGARAANHDWASTTAEIAVIDPTGDFRPLRPEDDVVGWLKPELVARVLFEMSLEPPALAAVRELFLE